MTDDLNDLKALKAAMRAATPAPDADAKARAMAQAMENFDRLQGSTEQPRSSQDRPERAGFLNGVKTMLTALTSRPALAATTSVAALLIGVAIILPVTQPALTPTAPKVEVPVSPEPVTSSVAEAADAPAMEAAPVDTPTKPKERPSETMKAADAEQASPSPDSVAVEADVIAEAVGAASVDADSKPDDETAALEGLLEQGDVRTRKEIEEGGEAAMAYLPAPEAVVAAPSPADPVPQVEENTESYATAPANPVKVTAEEPVSTFSTDVDTASYALVRSTLNMGLLPAPEQVRVEEMVNYFPYAYPAPEVDQAFRTTVSVMPTPWNDGTRLVTIGLQGALPAVADRPPLNLVFLIDTSGSMDDPMKLGLLKQSLALMLPELRPEDQVAIVTYAGSAGQVLPPTAARDRDTILRALDNLMAGGSTAGAEGLELAYQVAKGMQAEGEVSRILLATDGDFNVGVADPDGLEAYVAKKREVDKTYLSVLGFGRGNLDDAVMQALAQNGNGQAAYIDTLSEARKVLVDQLTGALFAIAEDVKVQVEWNPATVAEYRLIGYETRALAREDFNNDTIDAGEIGAGLQVTAIYEVTAPGSDALLNDPLHYGIATATGPTSELGFLRLRWKAPGAAESTLVETPITGTEPTTDEARFAAAIAGFGQLLQSSVYLGDWGWDKAIALALSAKGEDAFGYRTEAVTLMRLAQSLDR